MAEAGEGERVRFLSHPENHGSPATMVLNSASVRACSVWVVVLPWAPLARSNPAAALALGDSVMRTKSYRPKVRYQAIILPPAASVALRTASIRAGASLTFAIPC